MMRKLAMAMVVSGALGSSFANALGLGEIKMNSALNQPLDADVKLLNVGDLSKNQILPNLASHADFSRAGVERVFFLTGIKFDVELDGKGGAVLHLTSNRIVREPFLNFLIELHWPSGRLLREYTALLDPPLFSQAPTASVQQAVSNAPATLKPAPVAQTQTPGTPFYSAPAPAVTQNSRQTSPTAAATPAGEKKNSTVRVKKNDTLWGIAKENRPDRSVTVRQTMVAIQQQNPGAFIQNNINLLKSGQVLRIPSVEEIRRVSSSQAYQETSRQKQEWQSKKTIDATQRKEVVSIADAAAGAEPAGLLKLTADAAETVDSDLSESASGGSIDGNATGSGGRAGADASEQGAASAIANVENLEKELQNLQRLMTLKQEQLALLQTTQRENALTGLESQAQASTAEQEAVAEAKSETAGNVTEKMAEAADQAVLVDSESGIDQPLDEQAQTLASLEAAADQESRPEESVLDILTNNPLYVGVMIVVILGALILLGAISRRRNEEKEYPQDYQQDIDASNNEVELPDKLVDVDSVGEAADQVPVMGSLAEAENEAEAVVESSDSSSHAADSRKLLEEADIYIAYGRYERAVEILQPAVNDAPKNTALRLKLAEIFLASNKEASFSQQEADLQAIGDTDALAKLDELKAKYASSVAAGAMVTESLQQDVAEEVSQSDELEDLEFELPDFDLDEVQKSTDSKENLVEFSPSDDFFDVDAEPAKAESSNQDNLLEFSLDEPQQVSGEGAEDMDFLVDTDESATKLELAKAYIDMADAEAAQEILNEVVSEGSDEQQHEAKELLESLV